MSHLETIDHEHGDDGSASTGGVSTNWIPTNETPTNGAPATGAATNGCTRPPGERTPLVAVVGGGCAGTLVATNLLRRPGAPLRVVMIERSGNFGSGVAYATEDLQHLLNVPAQSMSAFREEPSHFVDWAARRFGGSVEGASYLPRGVYGEYLRAVLADSRARARPRRTLRLVTGEVIGLRRTSAAIELLLADGTSIACDRVVLATGAAEPAPIAQLPRDPRVVTNPWAPGALRPIDNAPGKPGEPGKPTRLTPGDSTELTLIVGTGLSAVDAALSIAGGGGRVLALSRGGRLPHAQLPGLRTPAPPPPIPRAATTLATLERLLTEHVTEMQRHGYDWRDAIDGLRAVTPWLWAALPVRERRRFLRERLRAWETRRHRMAPAVAARLRGLREDGKMTLEAGSVLAARSSAAGIEVDVAPGPSGQARTLTCARVVLCTGAGTDIRRSANPLLQALLSDGDASPDPLGLGLRSTDEGALLDSRGHADERLFTLGAPRRGELWETTALQEIRVQAERLAHTLERSLTRTTGSLERRPAQSRQHVRHDNQTVDFERSLNK
jgi:uncharacterized NAD(P)/FAD-binding protein YdhS